jgi:hypothetical protein
MPENFGALAGGMKDFFDRTFYPSTTRELLRPYGVFLCTGNDGSSALRQLQRIAKGYGWTCATEPIICFGEPSTHDFQQAEELGAGFAAGLTLGVF